MGSDQPPSSGPSTAIPERVTHPLPAPAIVPGASQPGGSSSSSNRPRPMAPAGAPAAAGGVTAPGGGGGGRGSFWAQLKIEIDPTYAPEWHPESSETTSIPAHISSDSPSEADTGITNIGPESFALPPERLPPKAEPRLARWLSRGLSGSLVALALAQLSVELAMFVQLRIGSSWWAGAFSLLVGALGLAPSSCLRICHRAFCIAGILLNAIAAVLDTRTEAILHTPSLRCGAPADSYVAMTIGQFCALDQRKGGSRLYSCGCVIPGSDPGDPGSCLAFHGLPAPASCDAGAARLAALVGASAILCWTLAGVCLVASVARVATSCYRHRRCPAPLLLLWRPREQTEPAYLRNSTAAIAEDKGKEKKERPKSTDISKSKAKVPAPYYLRDCPGGAV